MKSRQDVKRWLLRYRHYKRTTEQIQIDIEELHRTIDGVKAQRLTGMPGVHGTRSYRIDETLDRISDKEDELNKRLNDMMDARAEIEEAIKGLEDDTAKEALYYRYILGDRWEDVAYKMNYTWRNVHFIHSKALDEIASFHCFSH